MKTDPLKHRLQEDEYISSNFPPKQCIKSFEVKIPDDYDLESESMVTIPTFADTNTFTSYTSMSVESSFDAFMNRTDVKRNPHLLPRKADPVPLHSESMLQILILSLLRGPRDQFQGMIQVNPKLLEYRCEDSIAIEEAFGPRSGSPTKVRRFYGGTILHIIASLRPKIKEKNTKSKTKGEKIEFHVAPTVSKKELDLIIRKNCKGLAISDDFGRIPLHRAVLSVSNHMNEMSSFLKKMAYKCKDAAYSKSHIVIQETDKVSHMLKFFPDGASIVDTKGNTPLHYGVAIAAKYDYHEGSLSYVNENNEQFSGTSCVKQLLEAYPRAIGIKNNDGLLPIHILCNLGEKINLATLKVLLYYHVKEGVTHIHRNSDGDFPIHLALESNANFDVIRLLSQFDPSVPSHRYFAQENGNLDNALHLALKCYPNPSLEIISMIISEAPSCAAQPGSNGELPIRSATARKLPSNLIIAMLKVDMPIVIGKIDDIPIRYNLDQGIVDRHHYNSWWHIVVDCGDDYLDSVRSYLATEAMLPQILRLTQQKGPNGETLIDHVTENYQKMFDSLLRLYNRYELVLKMREPLGNSLFVNVLQGYEAIDYGRPSSDGNGNCKRNKSICIPSTSTSKKEDGIEVSLLSSENNRVLLRFFSSAEALYAEMSIREKYNLSSHYIEQIFDSYSDETFTNLVSSQSEKLHCISFQKSEHTMESVFEKINPNMRTKKWMEKSTVVIKQIALAIKHLHDKNLIHGHLDAQNIAKYGNDWKLCNVGTVTPIGCKMRGYFRPSIPPEAVVEARSEDKLYGGQSPTAKVSFLTAEKSVMNPVANNTKNAQTTEAKQINTGESKNGVGVSTQNQGSLFDVFGFFNNGNQQSLQYFSNGKQQDNQTLHNNNQSLTQTPTNSGQYVFMPENCVASPAWDMWGLGCIMVQLLIGKCTNLPNFEKAEDATLRKLYVFNNMKLEKICREVFLKAGLDASNLVSSLLSRNPEERPQSIDDVLKHRYFWGTDVYLPSI